MKKTLCLLVPVLAAVFSMNAQAASCGKTRAEVRAEIVALEAAGFNPAANDLDYPNDIRAAQRRLAEQTAQNGPTTAAVRCEAY